MVIAYGITGRCGDPRPGNIRVFRLKSPKSNHQSAILSAISLKT